MGSVGYAVIAFEADKVGSGIHQAVVADEDLVKYSMLANASQVMYGPLIFITKLSILLLYLRVFTPANKSWMYIFSHGLLWFNAAFYLADTLLEIFACTPREKIWHPEVDGRCVNVNVMILATAILNTLSDFSLLILPICAVWRLHMDMSRKLGISAVFAAGLLTAEITAGIIASSLPAVPSFFRHVGRKAITATSSRSKGTNTAIQNNVSRRRIWSLANRNVGKDGHDLGATRKEYNELDDARNWNGTSASHSAGQGDRSGRDKFSLSGSRTSEKGILKTIDIDVEESELH
ncbi:hypothetical protein BDV25DRAFT_172386 [Aspergillus avenaceus]|uniref:Rhodopsin domain-containing protein n=1 Tax=Aspergillus avenaceus TaxID=36643 RepID=A0A5N6U6Y4_ASPAV|nr:hypothetical protein BDV25DRAFT_172386 [Aspergillus avenaceus]